VGDLAQDVDRALDDACAEIRRQTGPSELRALASGQHGVVVDFRGPLARLLEAAEHEALGLGHNWVGTEHLLLAVMRLAGPRLCEILQRHGLGQGGVRQAVLEVLQA
jgi:ATP-dependent Clp protease ATP-binding subunit ClpC